MIACARAVRRSNSAFVKPRRGGAVMCIVVALPLEELGAAEPSTAAASVEADNAPTSPARSASLPSPPPRGGEGWGEVGVNKQPRSMIADIGAHLAAEHPIGPARVHEDDRQEEERADQEKGLGVRRGGGLPQGEPIRYDHRPQADADAEIGHEEEQHGADEGSRLRAV